MTRLRPKSALAKSVRHLLPPSLALLALASATHAAILYWDVNGAGTGATNGTTADGTWSLLAANPNWSTSANGNVATSLWQQGSTANFSAGTNATGASLIQLSSQRMDVSGINFNQGDVTITNDPASGTLGLASNFQVFAAAGASGTFSQLPGSALFVAAGGGTYNGVITRTGGGTVTFNTSPSLFSLVLDGGTTYVNTNFTANSSIQIGSTTAATVNVGPAGATPTLQGGTAGITVGVGAAATGTVNLNNYGLMQTNNANLTVGSSGVGIVNVESGGTMRVVGGKLVLASATGSTGTVNLKTGGMLVVDPATDAIQAGAGAANFNLAGGTIYLNTTSGSGLTTSMPMTLSGSSTFDTQTFNATLSGTLSGGGSLTKISAGTLTLSGQHTFTGTMTVNGGTLALSGAASALTAISQLLVGNDGTGTLSLTSGGSITTTGISRVGVNAGSNGTATIDGGAALNLGNYLEVGYSGTGTLNVTNGGHVSANTTVAFGLNPGGSGTGTVTGAGSSLTAGTTLYVGYTSSGVLTVGSGGTITAGTQIVLGSLNGGGAGALVLDPGGTINVGGTNGLANGTGAYGLYLQGGLLKVTGSSLTTSLAATLKNNTTIDTSGVTATLNGALSNTGGITKTGGGTLFLPNPNTYSGGTTVVGGIISVPAASSLGSGPVDVQGGSIQSTNTLSFNNGVTVDGAGSSMTAANFIEAGASSNGSIAVTSGGTVSAGSTVAFGVLGGVTGSGSVTGTGSSLTAATTLIVGYLGSGTVSVGGGGTVNAGAISLGGQPGGSGTFNLNPGGALNVGGTNGIVIGSGGSGTFNLAGGLLKVTGSSLTTAVPMTLSNGSLIDTSGVTATLNGALSGGGGLSKTGAGTLFLPNPNSYSGGTALYAGLISVPAASSLGSGPVSVLGGTLRSVQTTAGTGRLSFDAAWTVDGAGSTLVADEYLEAGAFASGSLTITNGGKVTVGTSLATGVYNAGISGSISVTGAGSTLTAGTTLFDGYIGNGNISVGAGGLISAATLQMAGAGGTGTFNLNAGGTLRVGGVNGINSGGTAQFNLAGGTLAPSSGLTTSVPMTLSNVSIIDTTGGDFTAFGALTGSGGFTKIGSGRFTVAQTDNYAGATTVLAGTLNSGFAGNSGPLGSGLRTMTGSSAFNLLGGTLQLSSPIDDQLNVAPLTLDGGRLAFDDALSGGIRQDFGTLTLAHSSIIDFGNNPALNLLQFSGLTVDASFSGLTVFDWKHPFGGVGDHLIFDAGGISQAQLALISFYDRGGQFLGSGKVQAYGADFEIIPEPSVSGLLLSAAGFGAGLRRRRQR